jgi:TetR/AcrR family transcriptional regulator, fatty acid metabolism regulator protein
MVKNLNKKNTKKERILKAATRVFAQNGFFHSKISQIAKLAQVADGTIYLYFKNKDDILISLFEEEMSAIIKNVKTEIAKESGFENKIKKFITIHLSFMEQNREMAEVFQIELRQSHKFMKDYSGTKINDYLNIISSIITQGQKDCEVKSDIDPGIAKRILFGALDELSSYWVISKTKKYNLKICARTVCEIYINGMKTKTLP